MSTPFDFNRDLYWRACHYNQRVPETGILYLDELSGPDGAHFTLFVEPGTTHELIARTKSACRNHWDVTGFSVIAIQPHWSSPPAG